LAVGRRGGFGSNAGIEIVGRRQFYSWQESSWQLAGGGDSDQMPGLK